MGAAGVVVAGVVAAGVEVAGAAAAGVEVAVAAAAVDGVKTAAAATAGEDSGLEGGEGWNDVGVAETAAARAEEQTFFLTA